MWTKTQKVRWFHLAFLTESGNGTTLAQITFDKTGDKIIFMNGTGTELSTDYY